MYALSWKSNGVYSSKLKPLHTSFWHSIKLSGYKMGIKFDKDPLAVEQINYLTKIIIVYIVYYLAVWPRNPTNNFKFKNYLFEATNIVKNSDQKSMYILDTDSAGSFPSDKYKNNFLILGINGIFESPEKKFSINFTKANTKLCLRIL